MTDRILSTKISEAKRGVPFFRIQKIERRRSLKSSILQAKPKTSQSDDIYEQEADHTAEKVMSMSENTLQRKCIDCDGDEEKILQAKELPGQMLTSQEQPIPSIVNEVLLSPGQPLDTHTRTYMEPRFAHDFSNVRVHTDSKAVKAAKAVNSLAYTMGQNIVFGAGQYTPGTTEGRKLLAHELAHVIQQKGMLAFQRKIAVQEEIDLSSYFTSIGISGFTKSGNVYSHKGASGITLKSEVLHSMLYSNRTFNVNGDTQLAAQINLDDNVKARMGIVDFASKKQFAFGAGPNVKMNPVFWEKKNDVWSVKPGINKIDAYKDININPQKYAIACLKATQAAMIAGSGNSPLKKDTGVLDSDWVPGEWGYIKNTGFSKNPKDAGLEGENLIYVGVQKFWGHFQDKNSIMTLDQWYDKVKNWNSNAKIMDHRIYPARGLL